MSGPRQSAPVIPARELRRQRRIRLRAARQQRWRHRGRRLRRAVLAVLAIPVLAGLGAWIAGGVSIGGVLLTFLAMIAAFTVLAIYPRTRSLTAGPRDDRRLFDLAKRSQAWLERQRGLLPGKTRAVADLIASRVDELAPRLGALPQSHPAVHELRKLLGEHLPSLVTSYTSIPAELTRQPHAGSTPAEQLHDGLTTVARELERIGKTIAGDDLDALAIRGRFLAARYEAADDRGE